jgi:hypothetical protein
MKSDRVTLRADDALIAFNCLRTCIRKSDEFLACSNGSGHDFIRSYRAEKWEAYQRIAKALGLEPTLDKVKEIKSA